jgi:hypothetical protein
LHSSLEIKMILGITETKYRWLNLAVGQISPAVSYWLRIMHKLNFGRRNSGLVTWWFHSFDLHNS